jgi:hypothetical protein
MTEPGDNSLYISWEYTPTVTGDVRTFVLEYTVVIQGTQCRTHPGAGRNPVGG